MNLFKKAAICTDHHIGLKNNSVVHNEDCLEFIKWFIDTAKKSNCDTVIILGDWHNHRASINILSLSYSLRCLELLNNNFDQVYMIAGNHDLFYRDRREVSSVEWAKHLPNITIINDFLTIGDTTFCPWLIGDEHKKLRKINSRYVFGHFELPTFYMNSLVMMPQHGEHTAEDLANAGDVFSGHFHKRQSRGNIHYIGNTFPHNYADAWDDERGMMVLAWGEKPEYITWPDQPTFRTVQLSQLIDNAPTILKPKQFLRVSLDIDISFEEASFIKETFINDYKLRELTLIPAKKSFDTEEVIDIKQFESIDQIVANNLVNIDSGTFNKNLLLSIYNGL
jgi:predicted phosphodiesterase